MVHAICNESNLLVIDLHDLLRPVEPSRWNAFEEAAREKLVRIRERVSNILGNHEAPQGDRHLIRLYSKLQALSVKLDEYWPSEEGRIQSYTREEWRRFQRRMQPIYASLTTCLEHLAVPVPALRPINYTRNIFHFSMGLLALLVLNVLVPANAIIGVAVGCAAWAWLSEFARARYPIITQWYMKLLGSVAHPHEHFRVNSATWFCSSLAVLAILFSPLAATSAIAVLAVADPVAANVGRRFGRTKIRHGRSLEGSLAFIGAGTLAVAIALAIWHPQLSLLGFLLLPPTAALSGALAELVSDRIDDNLTIPLGTALGVALVSTLLLT